jgi:hypothetical protein
VQVLLVVEPYSPSGHLVTQVLLGSNAKVPLGQNLTQVPLTVEPEGI